MEDISKNLYKNFAALNSGTKLRKIVKILTLTPAFGGGVIYPSPWLVFAESHLEPLKLRPHGAI